MHVRKQQLELDVEQPLVPNRKRSTSRLHIVTLLFFLVKVTFFLFALQSKIYLESITMNKASGDDGIPVELEATVRTGHGTTDWFQIGKGVHQGCVCNPAY